MANNYTQWSEYFVLESPQEVEWLKAVLHFDLDLIDENDNLSRIELLRQNLKDAFDIELSEDCDEYWVGFSFKFADDDSGVTFYSEESGNIENLVLIIQKFLSKFRSDDFFKLEWADTCSRPRVGEFGGGAVFVTADKIEWMSTSTWVSEKFKAFKSR